MKQQIRIIGGRFRGKKLDFPDVAGLRPTSDRVRETLFNWLMHEVRDKRCLDAFAGSGALGFEACSRGAGHVTFLEQFPKVFHHLKKTLPAFDCKNLEVIHTDAIHYLQTNDSQFDIVFLDPPFASDCLHECMEILAMRAILVKGGLVYTESPVLFTPDTQKWRVIKSRQAGNVFYALFEKI
ncbi:16S rRNA (guanine(966)-N(2))-methyltransferase RsmD [Legionella spiritensis]|uniref:Ribosomal RNA small subunit methyltransferase D n=1 Tax=Legionella spiritensis TaxID=452 RepID=A0A0W0Z5G3_LEGSP|nr:16S rRNA (guanine(966)-N(2))-methyltransferase RsmD [Legionella spiritensis]KTD64392.1 putative methylase [Legionella spiritensis]SNV46141.1 putative methylase [Legionella spiritensis]VEG91043.1 putative methylase [Legionella spiritensis]